jgi:hypothetical protein
VDHRRKYGKGMTKFGSLNHPHSTVGISPGIDRARGLAAKYKKAE